MSEQGGWGGTRGRCYVFVPSHTELLEAQDETPGLVLTIPVFVTHGHFQRHSHAQSHMGAHHHNEARRGN